MNKFIVVVTNSTPEQQLAVKRLFPPNRAAWWHWSSDVWLFSFGLENPTTYNLQEEIRRVAPGANVLVFRVPENAEWSGWGQTEWNSWFEQYWK
jgi:hypothetical protein